ncbi:MAG: DUF2304 domain-containing protein [Lachnospiraceae bacterium]
MTIMFRLCLVTASVLTMLAMMHKIRRSKVRIEDAIFWVLFSIILILFSIFPQIAYWISDLVGTQSPANLIFTMVIFLLLTKVFTMAVRISQLESRLQELVQKIALDEFDNDDTKKEYKTHEES